MRDAEEATEGDAKKEKIGLYLVHKKFLKHEIVFY